jgi:hypothetical protein
MGIRGRLRHEETIISDHHPYYATSQRVILLQEINGREELWELPYGRLTKVEVVKLPRHKMMIAGSMMIIGGAIMSSIGYFTSVLAIFGGIGAIIYGGIGREAYYQLHADDMTKEEKARWRLVYYGSGSFIRTIRTVTGKNEED